MNGIMVEFILWSDNPKINMHEIGDSINLYPLKIRSIGDVIYYGEFKNLKRVVDTSSLLYSTEYINTIDVEDATKNMLDKITPNLPKIINAVNSYNLNAKFCIVISLDEKPPIFLSREMIKLAAELSAEIDFDIYIDYE